MAVQREPDRVLRHVIAHEIGHLPMGSGSHSDAGLMRADWSRRDIRTPGSREPAIQRKTALEGPRYSGPLKAGQETTAGLCVSFVMRSGSRQT